LHTSVLPLNAKAYLQERFWNIGLLFDRQRRPIHPATLRTGPPREAFQINVSNGNVNLTTQRIMHEEQKQVFTNLSTAVDGMTSGLASKSERDPRCTDDLEPAAHFMVTVSINGSQPFGVQFTLDRKKMVQSCLVFGTFREQAPDSELQTEEFASVGFALFFEPIRVSRTDNVIVRAGHDGVQKPEFFHNAPHVLA
jgi:hypothetical protein